ncbi:MAG: UDP-N-acetylglucosamine 2-epimerase (non-hydrolyzing), partial [Candidatus Saganbacteria bacterium]|nr:UDP-N-acetylglucosamine 2-epimerase (non-hydrolyzing) [Candidatus Saganbacteria bacterium]
MGNRKRIMFVFGTRPEAIKMAPVIAEMQRLADLLEPIVVVTGQHREMLDQVLSIFNIKPDYDLGIMRPSQTLTDIVTRSLQGLGEILLKEKPDMLLVQGDTSTTFAAALAAFYQKISVGHIEAGLRTFDKWQPYPEEVNRKLTTALADLHFAPTQASVANLLADGISRKQVYLTGNSVIDALLNVVQRPFDLKSLGITPEPGKRLVLVTAHRRENFGGPIKDICAAVKTLTQKFEGKIQLVIPVHRNPKVRGPIEASLQALPAVKLIEPLDYEPFVHLMKAAYLILTDSGGVQEEAPSLGKPVLVLREKTERPEAVAFGTVKLVGTDREKIVRESERLLCDQEAYAAMSRSVNPYGDGKAAERIVSAILYYFGFGDSRPEEFQIR